MHFRGVQHVGQNIAAKIWSTNSDYGKKCAFASEAYVKREDDGRRINKVSLKCTAVSCIHCRIVLQITFFWCRSASVHFVCKACHHFHKKSKISCLNMVKRLKPKLFPKLRYKNNFLQQFPIVMLSQLPFVCFSTEHLQALSLLHGWATSACHGL